MIWLAPAALVGLLAVAVPIVVHLLVRHRASRVFFPSLRFVEPSATVNVRLRTLADWPLLVCRALALAAAAAACAQPLWLTGGRLSTWRARVARAVVVDASPSMWFAAPQASSPGNPSGAPIGEARLRGKEIGQQSWRHTTLEAPRLGDALKLAGDYLARQPPARREIVVISDFRVGSLTDHDLAAVPASVGLRFERVGGVETTRTAIGWPGLQQDARGLMLQLPILRIDPTGTAVRFESIPPGAREVPGAVKLERVADREVATLLDAAGPRTDADQRRHVARALPLQLLAAPDEQREADILLEVAARAGVPAPESSASSVLIALGGARDRAARQGAAARATGWSAGVLARLAADETLQEVAREAAAGPPLHAAPEEDTWTTIARAGDGSPLITGARSAAPGATGVSRLLIATPARAGSIVALTLVHATLRALGGHAPMNESEIARIPTETLARWTRPAPDGIAGALPLSEESDAAWCWAVAIALLSCEGIMRRRPPPASGAGSREDRRAA